MLKVCVEIHFSNKFTHFRSKQVFQHTQRILFLQKTFYKTSSNLIVVNSTKLSDFFRCITGRKKNNILGLGGIVHRHIILRAARDMKLWRVIFVHFPNKKFMQDANTIPLKRKIHHKSNNTNLHKEFFFETRKKEKSEDKSSLPNTSTTVSGTGLFPIRFYLISH